MLLTYLWNNWRYSDAPEGQRPFEKLVGLTKFGVFTSFGVGIYDSVLISQTTGFWQTVNCFAYWMVPTTAMCATFAAVAYTTTKIRGKDGYLNYVLPSLATGYVFYRWQKIGPLAHHFTMLLLVGAMIKKYGDLNNWNPLPLDMEALQQYTTFPYDFTIVKDPRGPRPWE